MSSRVLAVLVLVATLTFVCSPLATIGFNGFRPEQFPVPQTDPPVQPAGYAFSILGGDLSVVDFQCHLRDLAFSG